MADILIRGVDDAALERIDNDAAREGLSRNEYLKHQIALIAHRGGTTTHADLRRLADLAKDVLDEDVMSKAWD